MFWFWLFVQVLFNISVLRRDLYNLKFWRKKPSPSCARWRHSRLCEGHIKNFQHLYSFAFKISKQMPLVSWESCVRVRVHVCIYVWSLAVGLVHSSRITTLRLRPPWLLTLNPEGSEVALQGSVVCVSASLHTCINTNYTHKCLCKEGVVAQWSLCPHKLHSSTSTKTNQLRFMLRSCSLQTQHVCWMWCFLRDCKCIIVVFVCTVSKYISGVCYEEKEKELWKVTWCSAAVNPYNKSGTSKLNQPLIMF